MAKLASLAARTPGRAPDAPTFGKHRSMLIAGLALGILTAATPASVPADSVYRWVDAEGVTHLTSVKPAGNIRAERIDFDRTASAPRHSASAANGKRPGPARTASPEQAAQREAVLVNLQQRECVVALEALDRASHGAPAASPADTRRLQQTVDLNCSKQTQRRAEQEAMAAKLRVANGSVCLDARNRLAAMLEPGQRPQRAQLQAQQEFIEAHCMAPVR